MLGTWPDSGALVSALTGVLHAGDLPQRVVRFEHPCSAGGSEFAQPTRVAGAEELETRRSALIAEAAGSDS